MNNLDDRFEYIKSLDCILSKRFLEKTSIEMCVI